MTNLTEEQKEMVRSMIEFAHDSGYTESGYWDESDFQRYSDFLAHFGLSRLYTYNAADFG